MEILLLGIYSFFVWLIFIKFKWLPWTTPWKVAVAIFPIVALAAHDAPPEHLRADDERRPGGEVHRADRVAGARPRHRGGGREQPAGEEGRRAVPHRPDAVPERGATRSRRGSMPMRPSVGADRQKLLEVQARLADAAVRRAAVEGAVERGDRTGDVAHRLARTGAQARPAEHRARRRRRRQPVRSRAGRDERPRADRPDRRRARRRTGDPREAARPFQGRLVDRRPGQGADRDAPRRSSRSRRRRSRRRAPSSRTRAGISCRRPSSRRATARWSTSCCAPATSSPGCRSTR